MNQAIYPGTKTYGYNCGWSVRPDGKVAHGPDALEVEAAPGKGYEFYQAIRAWMDETTGRLVVMEDDTVEGFCWEPEELPEELVPLDVREALAAAYFQRLRGEVGAAIMQLITLGAA